MFAAKFARIHFPAKSHFTAFSWQRLVTQRKNISTNNRYTNKLAGIQGEKWRSSTFVFQIQHTGQSPTSNSTGTCIKHVEKHTIAPPAHFPRRFYHQNYNGVRDSNGKPSRLKYALGLAVGSLVCLGLGFYKLKTEVCSCDEQERHGPRATRTGEERGSITLKEAIDRSRDLATRIKDESGSPGLAISVSVDGKVVWSEGLGYADVENRVRCSADTVLRIASISKSITMVAVAKQLEAGTLDLDKPIQHYVPNFPEKKVGDKKVTITTRQLVSHLGGIRHYHSDTSKPKVEDKESTKKIRADKKSDTKETVTKEAVTKEAVTKAAAVQQPEMSRAEYLISDHYKSVTESLNLFKDDPLVHEPGSKFLYTSYGFTLLSAVLEAVAKQSFEKMMKEYFVQMGLDHTFLDENSPLIYNRGRHYMKDKQGRLTNTPYVDLSYKWAGGGFLSTAHDLTKFGHVMLYSYQHRSDTPGDQRKGQSSKANSNSEIQKSKVLSSPNQEDEKRKAPGFLKAESVKLLWKPVAKTKPTWDKFGYYGMGWAVVLEGENFGQCHHSDHIVSHTGGAIGGSSVLIIKPKNCVVNQETHGEPQGVVVAMIANMTAVGLYKTAVKVAKLFEEAEI